MAERTRGYTLVICEKPDAARMVADALSGGRAQGSSVEGVGIFRFRNQNGEFVVCSAQGHVYAVSDPVAERAVFPVFDLDWYPSDLVDDDSAVAGRRIAAIKKFAPGASKFVNACDYDVEGETIGFNVLRYACGGREGEALRAKFSTLTRDELVGAFANAAPQAGQGLARAGRARHLVDFVWGVNLSRMLSLSALDSGHRFRTVSIGRVQGPTLNFLVEREVEIREFVPIPFWKVSARFAKAAAEFEASYSKERIGTQSEAEKVSNDCQGKEGTVTSVKKSVSQVPPPLPFNIGDLQKEAYRVFGFSPSRTLQIAERLYLGALISYPRTGSQKLPKSIGYTTIVQRLGKLSEYSKLTAGLLRGDLNPVQGVKVDLAHPAIHPTGELPRRHLDSSEGAVFDLVVRRFLSAFAPPASRDLVSAGISVGEHGFRIGGSRTLSSGWTLFYGKYAWMEDAELPHLIEGESLPVASVRAEERFEQRPPRYNQSSLLEKMEREEIGTKATRADIISTLVGRGYVSGESMAVTDLGLAVIETMKKYAPSIITTELTREIERRLEAVEVGGEKEAALLRETLRSISEQLIGLRANEEKIGREIDAALMAATASEYILGPCPVCKTGQLRIIRSKSTKKRFVGCTSYSSGCRASAPLPQKGGIKTTSKPCRYCSWPVVYVTGGRRPWRLCINVNCPEKGGKKHEVPAV